MDEHGYDTCVPHDDGPPMVTRPLLDFGANYVKRAEDRLPRQGDRLPWSLAMSYRQDVQNLRRGAIEDPCLRFSRSPAATPGPPRRGIRRLSRAP